MPKFLPIVSISWGEIIVEGIGRIGDVKLWPGGGREWDWSETGTHHDPGIQPADVEELIAKGSEFVVLSRGMSSRLKLAPGTEAFLKNQGIPYYFEETPEAVKHYNRLGKEGKAVGGLFHSTC